MWKAIVGQSQGFAQTLVDLVAPAYKSRKSHVEDYWNMIQNIYQQQGDYSNVKDTNIPIYLDNIVNLLVEEDGENPDGECLEYVLEHKVFEVLVTLGKGDNPKGMRALVFRILDDVLTRIKQPLIPHISIHRSISELLRVCIQVEGKDVDEMAASVNFISIMCTKLHEKPPLLRVFCDQTIQDGQVILSLLPLRILQRHIHENDGLGHNARCGTLCLLQLVDHDIVDDVINRSGFLDILMAGLQNAYTQLPTAKIVGPPNPLYEHYRNLLLFCNGLAQTGHPKFVAALADALVNQFFKKIIRPALLQTSDTSIFVATHYTLIIVESLTMNVLAESYIPFFCDQNFEVNPKWNVAHVMTERIGSFEENIRMKTMMFFETVLRLHQNVAVYYLVSQHLNPTPLGVVQSQILSADLTTQESSTSAVGDATSFDDASLMLQAYTTGLSRLLGLLAWTKSDPVTIAAYHKTELFAVVDSFKENSWKPPAKVQDKPASESPFLRFLLIRLEKMFQQSLTTNMLLAKLILRLVTSHDHALTNMLLNPNQPSPRESRTLIKSLEKVAKEGASLSAKIDNFHKTLSLYHSRLQTRLNTQIRSPLDLSLFEDDHTTHNGTFQSAIVFEELCKELTSLFSHYFFYLDGFTTSQPSGL
eukprot:TRINITY_DN6248_c0_g2_i1.p1 TRINITY_DN6248_c0_g2~~TRINITY_DN6248_c0_g2_i1.p1  ORF type:complete len:646 (-),score=135.16 TRINITY_DN6248_c0_g2_i1:293-2230(-)